MQNEFQIQNTSQEDISIKDENGPNLVMTNVRSLSDMNTTSGEKDMMSPPPKKKVKASESSDPGTTSDKSETRKDVNVRSSSATTPMSLPSPVVNCKGSKLTINDARPSVNHSATTTKTILKDQLSICIICNNDLNPAKSPTLSARAQTKCQLNGVDPKVGDLLKWVVYDENLLQDTFYSLPPPPPGLIERRKMCSPCSTYLKNVYESVTKLRKAFNPEGYLGNYIMKKERDISPNVNAPPKTTCTVSTQTSEQLKGKTKEVSSKLIGTQIKESIKNARQHTSFTNSVHKMLRQQIVTLTKTDGLLNHTKDETASADLNLTQINKDLEIFVKTKCPLLWRVMLALFQKNYKTTDAKFTMQMQIALGMAGRVHNLHCSGLQRNMAIFLWRNGASKNVIETLYGFGLSRSYGGSLKFPEVKLISKKRVKKADRNKNNTKTLKLKSTKKIVRKYAGMAKNRTAKVKPVVPSSTKSKIK